MAARPFTFYEFFAGGGMARAGLGEGWRCLFANDFDPKKTAAYRANWGANELTCKDVADVSPHEMSGRPDLVWASFPCQDLSLAGDRRGLGPREANAQFRSAAFWPFWRLVEGLIRDSRGPSVVVLENVVGILTANRGSDFAALADALADGGFRFGALVMDARLFLPQSRPRVFIVGVRAEIDLPEGLTAAEPDARWTPRALRLAQSNLAERARRNSLWWRLPAPESGPALLSALIEHDPSDVAWHAPEETRKLLAMMSAVNRAKVEAAARSGRRRIGTLYRRTRPAPGGGMQVRAEVRFDEVAGCLRTPAGGSSRQNILVVEGERIRSRLLSGREAARLMGLPDGYKLPPAYNDAYHLAGDGVAVPVVRHLARWIIEPALSERPAALATAA